LKGANERAGEESAERSSCGDRMLGQQARREENGKKRPGEKDRDRMRQQAPPRFVPESQRNL
jgi:hypothetical protein